MLNAGVLANHKMGKNYFVMFSNCFPILLNVSEFLVIFPNFIECLSAWHPVPIRVPLKRIPGVMNDQVRSI